MRQINNWIAKVVFLMVIMTSVAYGDDIKFKKITLSPGDKTWLLNAEINLELSPALEQLVKKGVTLHFVTEFQLTKGRWYWFDERPAIAQRQTRLSYQPLTQQYRIASEGFTFSAKTIAEALQAVGSIGGWRVIDANQLDAGKSYTASLRMTLDLSKLPKPFQVNALNNRDWNVSSDWLRFPFSPAGASLIKR